MSDEKTIISRVRLAFSALLGRPFGTDDEAVEGVTAEMSRLKSELQTVQPDREFARAIRAELGEADLEKATAKIKALRQVETTAAAGRKTQLEAQAETVMLKHEKKVPTVPLRAHFKAQVVANLEAGQEIGKTDTEKLLSGMSADSSGATTRASGADDGESGAASEDQLAQRTAAILVEDPECVALTQQGQKVRAFKIAGRKALAAMRGAAA